MPDDARGTRRACGIIDLATAKTAPVATNDPLSLGFAPDGPPWRSARPAETSSCGPSTRSERWGKADRAARSRRGGQLHRLCARRQIAGHGRIRQQRQDLGPRGRRGIADLQAQRHGRGRYDSRPMAACWPPPIAKPCMAASNCGGRQRAMTRSPGFPTSRGRAHATLLRRRSHRLPSRSRSHRPRPTCRRRPTRSRQLQTADRLHAAGPAANPRTAPAYTPPAGHAPPTAYTPGTRPLTVSRAAPPPVTHRKHRMVRRRATCRSPNPSRWRWFRAMRLPRRLRPINQPAATRRLPAMGRLRSHRRPIRVQSPACARRLLGPLPAQTPDGRTRLGASPAPADVK